jgi:hypothetical protein
METEVRLTDMSQAFASFFTPGLNVLQFLGTDWHLLRLQPSRFLPVLEQLRLDTEALQAETDAKRETRSVWL